ncbi:hypothetical protein [Streptomyces spiralis]|uniref:hypothetical protein n=1 Tax=Streptomyces spiralis TaxID=66376 RepID=UPI0036CAE581
MGLTAAHWTYLAGVVVIIAVMIARRNVVVPAVIATFLTSWFYSGNLIKGLAGIFNASLTAAGELFSIFLIIAIITALLGGLRAMGAERRMVRPFRGLMRNSHMAFLSIAAATYFISLFFWPTPAVPLIGALLLPAAIRAGLPAMTAAAVMAIAGQGMALSSDYVIQVAPGLSAKAAGTDTGSVADRAMVLSLITGIVALVFVYWRTRRGFGAASDENELRWRSQQMDVPLELQLGSAGNRGFSKGVVTAKAAARATSGSGSGGSAGSGGSDAGAGTAVLTAPGEGDGGGVSEQDGPVRRSQVFAVLVPLAFAVVVGYMLLGKFTGLVPEVESNDAAGLVGGVAMLLLFGTVFTLDGTHGLTTAASHVVDGLVFAFKAMGVVIPIAGFFFLGNADFISQITGTQKSHPPALLFDLVKSVDQYLPGNGFILGFAILVIGMITGLEGSGFAGLPLTGSLAGALGPAAHTDPATLAAVGQMGSVWTGGGTLIAWSSLLAVAGVARVPVQELVRQLFVPVVVGLTAATALSTLLF